MLSCKIVKPLQSSFSTLPTSAWLTPTTPLSFKTGYHRDKNEDIPKSDLFPSHGCHIIVTTEPKNLYFSLEFHARRKRLGAWCQLEGQLVSWRDAIEFQQLVRSLQETLEPRDGRRLKSNMDCLALVMDNLSYQLRMESTKTQAAGHTCEGFA